MKDEFEAHKLIESSFRGDRVYNEVIIRYSPARVYFDIDLKMKQDATDGTIHQQIPEYDHLLGITEFLIEFMKFYYDIEIKKADFTVLQACTSVKRSYHILLPYTFPNFASREEFGNALKCAIAMEDAKSPESTIGTVGYTQSQVFRMIFNRKRQLIANHLKPLDSISRDQDGGGPSLDFSPWPVVKFQQFKKGMLQSDESPAIGPV